MVYAAMGAVLAIVLALVLVGANTGSNTSSSTTATTAGAKTADCTSDTNMDVYTKGGSHTDASGYDGPLRPLNNPTYTVNPPSGGDHLSVPAPAGVYTGNNVPPDGNLVHSLEHGYVIIWFKPGLLDQVRPVYNAYPKDVLLVERSNMDQPVAATAWGHRLLCSGVDVNQLKAFVARYRNQGPEKIPH
ncbi:MAG TPA: DUF3105 domain-containing protein [Acidimicrobiales bacterium]|nr:DUF3105 domain-containing protein [Acidimicrobiales bacterium]